MILKNCFIQVLFAKCFYLKNILTKSLKILRIHIVNPSHNLKCVNILWVTITYFTMVGFYLQFVLTTIYVYSLHYQCQNTHT